MDVDVIYIDCGRVIFIFLYIKLEYWFGEFLLYFVCSEYFSILICDILIFVVLIFVFEKVFVIEIKNFYIDKYIFMYD